jgi:hypothetical protein
VKRDDALIPLESPEALPLEANDELEADVRVDRTEDAYLYLVRIGPTQLATLENGGRAVSLSPPVPSPGIELPETGFEVKTVATESLVIDREGPSGVMTRLLLSRKEPLPDAFRDELNRVLAMVSVEEPVLPNAGDNRFVSSRPKQAPLLSQVDLQPLIDRDSESVPMTDLVEALLPYFDRIERVSFPVPELTRPAQAERASDRIP